MCNKMFEKYKYYEKIHNNSTKYDKLNEKFANLLMKNGNKCKAYNILYNALKIVYIKNLINAKKKQTQKYKIINYKLYIYINKILCKRKKKNALFSCLYNPNQNFLYCKNLLDTALNNVKPFVETKAVKVSGKIYQVPKIISKKKQNSLAIKWIIENAKKKKKYSNMRFYECLALELLEALNKHGKVFQKRNELHKLAESNRAYMRFKWW